MTWFIVCWIVGAIASWIGTTVYIKNRTTWTWKGFIEVAKANMESPLKEALKWLLYMVIWPIETAAWWYIEKMIKPVIPEESTKKES